jgi:hypothetical protein
MNPILTTVAAHEASVAAVEAIGTELAGAPLSDREKVAAFMGAVVTLMQAAANALHDETGKPQREIVGMMTAAALEYFPEKPVKVEDIPSRPVPSGKSPWGW